MSRSRRCAPIFAYCTTDDQEHWWKHHAHRCLRRAVRMALALVLGVLLAVLAHLAEIVPGFESWLVVVLDGLLAGFIAMGMYDTQKAARK